MIDTPAHPPDFVNRKLMLPEKGQTANGVMKAKSNLHRMQILT